MAALLSLGELLRTALASGAVGFTLRTGVHPTIYSAKGVQTYDTQPSTCEDIEQILRELMSSREMRQFRKTDVVHFKGVFEDDVPLLGGARIDGAEIHVELRRMAA